MRKSIFTVAVLAAGVAAIGACALHDAAPATLVEQGTVLRDVTVVDTRTGGLTPRMAVVIDQGTIKQVLPDASVRTGGSAKVVDGSGKFVVPGYLDMHTHAVPMSFGPAPAWPLMIANGITGIREMAGAPPLIAAVQKINAARAAGMLDAPQVLQMPGPPYGGVRTAVDGIADVRQTKAMGGSFVKVVGARPEALFAILQEAKAQGLDVSGHLSVGVSAVDTANAGWKSIEHLGGIWSIQLDCATDEAAIRAAELSGKGAMPPNPFPPTYPVSPFIYSAGDAPFVQRAMDTYDDAKCQTVAKAIVDKGTWQVPTMIRLRTMLQSDNPSFVNDPNLKYVDPTTRMLWNQLSQRFTALQPSSAAVTLRNYDASFVKMLKVLRANGAAPHIMAGTDVGGIWVIPGFSLHQEFHELADAGFTPLEVLQATTLNGARFLDRESTMGTVEANKNADLVLLDANPLLDVANLSKIAGVFNAGKYFSKSDLDDLKAKRAAANAAAPIRQVSTVLDPNHRD